MIENNHAALSDDQQKLEEIRTVAEASAAFRTITCGDTTVHLRFNDSGDLSARLASAFSAMLK